MPKEQTTEQLDITEFFARPVDVEQAAKEQTRKSTIMLDQGDVLDMLDEVIATAKREGRGRLSLKDAATMLIRAGFHSYAQRERARERDSKVASRQARDIATT